MSKVLPKPIDLDKMTIFYKIPTICKTKLSEMAPELDLSEMYSLFDYFPFDLSNFEIHAEDRIY